MTTGRINQVSTDRRLPGDKVTQANAPVRWRALVELTGSAIRRPSLFLDHLQLSTQHESGAHTDARFFALRPATHNPRSVLSTLKNVGFTRDNHTSSPDSGHAGTLRDFVQAPRRRRQTRYIFSSACLDLRGNRQCDPLKQQQC